MSRRHRVLVISGLMNFVFLYGPIAALIVFSFNASRLSTAWHGFTLQWYGALLADRSVWDATGNSVLVAVCSTALAVVLGVLGAVGLERRPDGGGAMVEGALLLPLVIPEVLLGVSLMLLFLLMHWPLSLVTVTIGHAAFNLPVVMMVVRARLRRLDPDLEAAARDLGATEWTAFRRVTLPLLMPAIAGAALLAFTISLDDFLVTFFTGGPGSTTLPLKVYSMIKAGVSPVVNAVSAIIVVVSMLLVALALRLQRWGEDASASKK